MVSLEGVTLRERMGSEEASILQTQATVAKLAIRELGRRQRAEAAAPPAHPTQRRCSLRKPEVECSLLE